MRDVILVKLDIVYQILCLETLKSKVIFSLYEKVRLSVSMYNSLKSIKVM